MRSNTAWKWITFIAAIGTSGAYALEREDRNDKPISKRCEVSDLILNKSIVAISNDTDRIRKPSNQYKYLQHQIENQGNNCLFEITVYFDEGDFLRNVATFRFEYSDSKLKKIDVMNIEGNFEHCEKCVINTKGPN